MRALKLVTNWAVILTMPIWGGFFLLASVVADRGSVAKRIRSGTAWFWE